MKKRHWVAISSLVVAISSIGYTWHQKNIDQQRRDISEYTVQAVKGRLPGLVTASGELQANRTVNLSPEKQGVLEELFVKEGDKVQEGQIIAKMQSKDFAYRLNELKADFETKKAAFARRKELFKEGAISAEQFDEYKNLYLTSKARYQQRKVEGNELLIRAPFTGIITTRFAQPGAFVTPTTRASSIAGSANTSIVELSQGLEVVSKVPESDIGRIRIGQKANVRVDAFPDQRFESTVREIAPRAAKKDNVTSFEVTLELINPPEKLRIGMTADIDFNTGKTKENTLVPTVAIVTENGKPGVLIVGKKNQPTFQNVELGNSSGNKTAILSGIDPGNLIFIDLPPWSKRIND